MSDSLAVTLIGHEENRALYHALFPLSGGHLWKNPISFVRSFRGSVYTGRMPAPPFVRVMKKEPDVYEVEVAAARPTLHCITARVGDVECLTDGKANAERLIEESFRFLLERESNTSILRWFRITDTSRYFPEYESEIRHRLVR